MIIQNEVKNYLTDQPTVENMEIIKSYLHPEMEKYAVEVVKDVFGPRGLRGDAAAAFISKYFDELYGTHWQVLLMSSLHLILLFRRSSSVPTATAASSSTTTTATSSSSWATTSSSSSDINQQLPRKENKSVMSQPVAALVSGGVPSSSSPLINRHTLINSNSGRLLRL